MRVRGERLEEEGRGAFVRAGVPGGLRWEVDGRCSWKYGLRVCVRACLRVRCVLCVRGGEQVDGCSW